jgi:hypothetical protein
MLQNLVEINLVESWFMDIYGILFTDVFFLLGG